MKVLLINPPRLNEIVGNNPAIIEEERGYNPPLGILYIAACLEERSSHAVEILDAQVEELSYEGLGDRIAASGPDVVGISAMTLCLLDVIKTIKTVKESAPEAVVVIGGPHVHLFPDETIALEGVDYLVLGEGEVAFLELIDAMGDNEKLLKVPGIVFKRGEETVKTPPAPLIQDLDELPHPARHLTRYDKYSSILSPYKPVTTIFTSRGCPFSCSFCDRPHLGKRFRARSAGNVVDEFIRCKEMGIKYILVYDDTFTVDKKRVMDICGLLIKNKVEMHWDIRARVDTITTDMLKKLGEAGCCGIHYGIESGTDRILEVLDKRISLKKAEEIFKETKKAGIMTLAYFMIGCPTETREEMRRTVRFAMKLNPDYLHATVLTPFPGTKLYRTALRKGVIKSDVWREFAADPTDKFIPPVWEEGFTRDELAKILEDFYKSFYKRTSYVISRLGKIKSFGQFKKYVRVGAKVYFGSGNKEEG